MNDMKQLERLISASVSPYHCIMTAAASLEAPDLQNSPFPVPGNWSRDTPTI